MPTYMYVCVYVRKRMWKSGLIYETGLAEQHEKQHERSMIIYIT